MTTGRINQIATRKPTVVRHRHPTDESPGTCSPKAARDFSVNSFRAGSPVAALPYRSRRAREARSLPFIHYPKPRFRGRDSRSRPFKSFTRDQQPFPDPTLEPERWIACTAACDRNVHVAFIVGTTPGFRLSPNDQEVPGEASHQPRDRKFNSKSIPFDSRHHA